jgi:hypothetical protein
MSLGTLANPQAAQEILSKANQSADASQPPEPAQSLASSSGPQNICFQGGVCVNIPTIASGSLTETNGGLGGSLVTSLSDVFDQLVAQLKAQNADPALISLVTQLAKQGHSIGDSLQTVQAVCSVGGGNNAACDTAKGGALNASMFKESNSGDVFTSNIDTTSFTKALSAVDNYIRNHPGTYDSVGTLIDMESSQITNIAQGMNLGIEMTSGLDSLGHQNFNITAVNNKAVLVHQDANTICSAGGNTHLCVQNVNTPPAGA